MDIKTFGIVKESITDGLGIRYTIFAQGCKHNCFGCHNPESHSFNGGYTVSIDEIMGEIKESHLIDGITFSGGDPFYQPEAFLELAKRIKNEVGHLSIWAYTGFIYEELIKNNKYKELLTYIDVLVDGRYVEGLRSLELKFKGSSNQRLIDVQKTIGSKMVTLYEV